MIEIMKQIIRQNDLCVLATTDRDRPHSSLMSYVTDDECRHLYLVTSPHTTKFANLSANPNVSVLIDDREASSPEDRGRVRSLTITGKAAPVKDAGDKAVGLARLAALRPHLKPITGDPEVEVVEIKIETILFLDGVAKTYHEKLP